METINYVKFVDKEIIKKVKELVKGMESVSSIQARKDMRRFMKTLDSGESAEDIVAMKKIGRDFETLSFNLLNIAYLIERKFKT